MSSDVALDAVENPRLTIRDRMDWPYLLQVAIHTLFNNLRNIDIEPGQLEITVGYLEGLIPDSLRDEEFNQDLNRLTQSVVYDLRPRFGGHPMSDEICSQLGITAYEVKRVIDPTERFHALMNLLQRIGVVAQKDRVEKFGGKWKPEETPHDDDSE